MWKVEEGHREFSSSRFTCFSRSRPMAPHRECGVPAAAPPLGPWAPVPGGRAHPFAVLSSFLLEPISPHRSVDAFKHIVLKNIFSSFSCCRGKASSFVVMGQRGLPRTAVTDLSFSLLPCPPIPCFLGPVATRGSLRGPLGLHQYVPGGSPATHDHATVLYPCPGRPASLPPQPALWLAVPLP